jgi:prepilin-type N-terminal cleavage/methylation domain-containing protein
MNIKCKVQNAKCKINESGFTLIELLISMTIGLIILGSIFSTFTTQKKAFATQEMITVMEQDLRFAMEFITRDLRNAGCNPDIDSTLAIGTSVGIIPGTDSGTTTNITINSIRILSDFYTDLNSDGDFNDTVGGVREQDTAADGIISTGSPETARYTFTGEDLDGDGVLDFGEDANSNGFLDSGDIRRNGQPMVQYITALKFTYYNSAGTAITVPITTAGATNLSNIRLVEVKITARTSSEDPNHTAGGLNITGTDADGMCWTRTLTARVRTRNIGLQRNY